MEPIITLSTPVGRRHGTAIDLRSPDSALRLRTAVPLPLSPVSAAQSREFSSPVSGKYYVSPFFPPTATDSEPMVVETHAQPSASSTYIETSESTEPDSLDPTASINTFHTGVISRMNNVPATFMWDSGANRSGTSNASILRNVTDCEPMSIQGAFGPPTHPTLKGELGPLKLDTVVIDAMGPQTIISVSQVCQLGHVVVFTGVDFRVYKLDSVLTAMKVLAHEGKEVARGTVVNGLYIQTSN